MVDRAIDDKSPDTLVVVSGEGFWTGSSTLPHLHHFSARAAAMPPLLPAVTNQDLRWNPWQRLPLACSPSP
jgi:hypothetical protein